MSKFGEIQVDDNGEDCTTYHRYSEANTSIVRDAYTNVSSPNVDDDHKFRDFNVTATDYIYTRDMTGTVVGVSSTFNVPRHQIVLVETRHAFTGVVYHRELRFKNDVSKFFTSTWDPHPDFPSAHRDIDENTTTHYRVFKD